MSTHNLPLPSPHPALFTDMNSTKPDPDRARYEKLKANRIMRSLWAAIACFLMFAGPTIAGGAAVAWIFLIPFFSILKNWREYPRLRRQFEPAAV